MRRYFKTRESAVRHLEIRHAAAIKRIEKKGWKIVKDTSMVYFDCMLKQMWTTMLMIYTDEMIKDLLAFQSIDVEAELTKALSEISPELNKMQMQNLFKLSDEQRNKKIK